MGGCRRLGIFFGGVKDMLDKLAAKRLFVDLPYQLNSDEHFEFDLDSECYCVMIGWIALQDKHQLH